jgi:hypothetical protein
MRRARGGRDQPVSDRPDEECPRDGDHVLAGVPAATAVSPRHGVPDGFALQGFDVRGRDRVKLPIAPQCRHPQMVTVEPGVQVTGGPMVNGAVFALAVDFSAKRDGAQISMDGVDVLRVEGDKIAEVCQCRQASHFPTT